MTFFKKIFSLKLVSITLLFAPALFSQQNSLLEKRDPVTVAEYSDFLNCVAATDTYSLYNEKMGEDEGGGSLITRSGHPGKYRYSYDPDKASLPIMYVAWTSALRYCNWNFHHGVSGFQDSTTTETGSYDLTEFDHSGDISTIVLAPGATFFLPKNYLFDTTLQESNGQVSGSTLSSNRLGFCIARWTKNASSVEAATGNGGFSDQVSIGGVDGASSVANRSNSITDFVSRARNLNFKSTSFPMMGVSPSNNNSNKINIDLVVVGAPNNPADIPASGTNTTTNQVGYGSVLMPYQIGKYDVTAEQYCAFLNAVANKSDSNGLYNTNMTSDPYVACITRSGDAASGYTYTPISGREKFPITYVAWYSALRFCNWLENGQPTGDQAAVTTENGSYDIASIRNGFNSISKNTNLDTNLSLIPQQGAAWLLPTEDQWYKAAYYVSSTNSTNGIYYAFGTGSIDAPGNKWEEAVVANRANYALNGSFTTTNQPRITPVGSFINSASPWGAYDMAGEVNQWTSSFDKNTNNIIRGGSWKSQTSDELKSTFRLADSSGGASPTVGFRVIYNIPPAPVVTHLNMMKDLVPIGDPDNVEDYPSDLGAIGFGKVSRAYQIGKYDVTAEQYCMFLNAVAAHSDPHYLYHPGMTLDPNVACIIRYGNTNRGYSYFTWPGREKFPITYVNFFSAVRFCNWLENNQPIGEESQGTTESGSYNRSDNGLLTASAKNHSKWHLPTENQWYKAAYYNAQKTGYYNFGTASNIAPNNLVTEPSSANYCKNGIFTTLTAPYLTPVGAFTTTKSPYGLYDMTGEVGQWTGTFSVANDNSTSGAIVRGGSWQSTNLVTISKENCLFIDPNQFSNTIGFRLVYDVEPPPPTVWENISHGGAVCKAAIKNDIQGLLTGEIFKKPGTYFFNVMYYSVGAGLAEIAAKVLNSSVYALNFVMKQIPGTIKYLTGRDFFEPNAWPNWIKNGYNFLFEKITSKKVESLKERVIEAKREQMRLLASKVPTAEAVSMPQAAGASEAGGNASIVQPIDSDSSALRVATSEEAIESAEVGATTEEIGAATAELAAAEEAVTAATAELAAEEAAVTFFASPAAAVIIPAILVFGSYEAFIATTNNSSEANDPRIGIGLVADTIVRYVWTAVRLLL